MITERIEYKLLSVIYKVLTTIQPSYLPNLITVQSPRSTRSSSLVTLACPSTSASPQVTGHSFQYASPPLWNQLINFIHQKNFDSSINKEKIQKKKETRSQHTETRTQTTQVIAW